MAQSSQQNNQEVLCIDSSDVSYIKDDSTGHLGAGSFGVVIAGFYSNKAVAAKCSVFGGGNRDRENLEKQVKDELSLLYRAHHDNVVRVYGWTIWKHSVAIIMEYMPGGDLWALLQNKEAFVSMKLAFQFCFDIACGLSCIHQKHLVHGDIKPENILVDEFLRCKVADFGCAKLSELYTGYSLRSKMLNQENHFTAFYAAPELLENQYIPRNSSQDVYSFALLIYVIFERDCPISRPHLKDVYISQTKAGERPQFSEEATKRLQKLQNSCNEDKVLLKIMRQCWDHLPNARPSMLKVKEDMQKVFQDLNKDEIASDVEKCKQKHKILLIEKEKCEIAPLTEYEIPQILLGRHSTEVPRALETDTTGRALSHGGIENDDAGANQNFNHQQLKSASRYYLPQSHLQPPLLHEASWQYYYQPYNHQAISTSFPAENPVQPVISSTPRMPAAYSAPLSSQVQNAGHPGIPTGVPLYDPRSFLFERNLPSQPTGPESMENKYYNPPSRSPQYQRQAPGHLQPFPVQNLVITLQLVPSSFRMVPYPQHYYSVEPALQPYTSATLVNLNATPTNVLLTNPVGDETTSSSTTNLFSSNASRSVASSAKTPSTSLSPGRIQGDTAADEIASTADSTNLSNLPDIASRSPSAS